MTKSTDIGGGPGVATLDVNNPPELPAAGTVAVAKEHVKNLAGEAKEQAKKVAAQARDQVEVLAERRKQAAAERLGGVAEALRETGRKLEEKDPDAPLGRYADKAAGQMDRFSGYLRTHDLRDLVQDAKELTRRRPGLVLAGTFLAGLVLVRFLKGSAAERAGRS
jgi:hypothetical protein